MLLESGSILEQIYFQIVCGVDQMIVNQYFIICKFYNQMMVNNVFEVDVVGDFFCGWQNLIGEFYFVNVQCVVFVFVVQLVKIEFDQLLYSIQVQVVWYYWIVDKVVIEELQVRIDVEFCFNIIFIVVIIGFGYFDDVVYYQYVWCW